MRRISYLAIAGVLAIDTYIAAARPGLSGDSVALVTGAQKLVDCFHHGQYTHCQTWNGGTRTAKGGVAHVGAFPLLQYLPAMLLRQLGYNQDTTLKTLIIINAIAIIAIFVIGLLLVRAFAEKIWEPIIAVAFLASPMLMYAAQAFGEPLAALMVLVAIAVVLLRAHPALIGAAIAFACVTKETNVVFVVPLAVGCVLLESKIRRNALIAIGVGGALGILMNAGFNIVRFGTPRNTTYLSPVNQVPNLTVWGHQFGALWAAPNGGLLWFWPWALLIIGLGAVCAQPRVREWASWVPLGIAGILIAEIVGLAKWYSPFGWIGWGPRLLIPMMPALLVVAAIGASKRATRTMSKIVTGWLLWPVAAITILLGLPEILVLHADHPIGRFFKIDAHCTNTHVSVNRPKFFACNNYTAWAKRPYLLQRGLDGIHSTLGVWAAGLFAVAVLSLLLTARKVVRPKPAVWRRGKNPPIELDTKNLNPRFIWADKST